MTNIIPVIMLVFQTRVMGDGQASGLETDSTEGRTVKERAGAWSRVPRSSCWAWWGPELGNLVTGELPGAQGAIPM